MYGRSYAGRELQFEPSGGLMFAALVMQDKQTDSYWALMTGTAVAGPLSGTRLDELPVAEKAQWKDWRRQHPDTKVLSVGGAEHVTNNPFDNYFTSDAGYRKLTARDPRLPTKEPVYALLLGGRPHAVPFSVFEGGRSLKAAGRWIFLYRPADAALYYSTRAFAATGEAGFRKDGAAWIDAGSGARFDPATASFLAGDGPGPERLGGFDTFWYVWSLTHPDTELLRP